MPLRMYLESGTRPGLDPKKFLPFSVGRLIIFEIMVIQQACLRLLPFAKCGWRGHFLLFMITLAPVHRDAPEVVSINMISLSMAFGAYPAPDCLPWIQSNPTEGIVM
jgi:hypothetical protein